MKLTGGEKAVSPVIGVILMVAITVILAAVIAAFVFGFGTMLVKEVKSCQLEEGNYRVYEVYEVYRDNLDNVGYYKLENTRTDQRYQVPAPCLSNLSISLGDLLKVDSTGRIEKLNK